ncbi:MAG: Cdc6/Cdc18 family protein, partial [Candidatus Helarchaeota archaeon]
PTGGQNCQIATMEYIIKKVASWMNDKNKPNFIIYFNNCAMYNTPYRILRQLCLLLKETLPSSGFSTEVAYSRFVKAYQRQKEPPIILILDELDFLFEKRRTANNLLYRLIRPPPSIIPSLKISIFGITNDVSLMSCFDTRVQSSFIPKEIYFPPYTALELQTILYQRATTAFKPNTLGNGAVEFIAGHFAQKTGDARQAIAILRTSGELAEAAGDSTVSEIHARSALKIFSTITRQQIIKTLPNQSKKILESIQNLQERGKNKSPISGEVYQEYKKLCMKTHHHILTYRQFSNHLKDLEKLNLINAEDVHLGKGGNTRKITSFFS